MNKKEEVEVMDHDYDGIQELDNDLPTWWMTMFAFTVVFGIAYAIFYHVLDDGDLMGNNYRSELKRAETAKIARLANFDALTPEEQSEQLLIQGQAIFKSKCALCHGPEGQGMVGPNLTDKFFLHGASLEQIRTIIADGKIEKAMPVWKEELSARELDAAALYVHAMKGKNLPGKEAQGVAGE